MPRRILQSPADLTAEDIRALYDRFDVPIIPGVDCGQMCAPHNPTGKPFCCDICHAVPAAYTSEWAYLQPNTSLWRSWRGDECTSVTDPVAERTRIEAETPDSMILLACKGPTHCERPFRTLSCRQFPFFPYVTAEYRFLGLAYEWEFEGKCWIISQLEKVSPQYRTEFIATFDQIFALFDEEFDGYAQHSAEMREFFRIRKHRITILHRNSNNYLLSPDSERLKKVVIAKDFPLLP